MVMIAVPSRDGEVDEHFGHCEAFTLFRVDGPVISCQGVVTPPPGCGCHSNIVPALAERGVTVMLAGNMGQGAVNMLAEYGIQVWRGASGPVERVVESWRLGALQDSQQLCQSHDCTH